jgi:hypothetical protein
MASSPTRRPARIDGLEINEVADGLVVYQADPERVHYLNNTAAVVFELCDGRLTVAEITEQVAATFSLTDPPASEVEACVAELSAKGVLR